MTPPTLLTMPLGVLEAICNRLPTVDDVLNLQNSHPTLRKTVEVAFWPGVSKLLIGDRGTTSIETTTGFTLKIEDNIRVRLPMVVKKACNLHELFISRDDFRLDDRVLMKIIKEFKYDLSRRLKKISVAYHRPELVGKSHYTAWPSHPLHLQIVRLIRSSAKRTLTNFIVSIGDDGDFISISVQPSEDLEVIYNHEPSWEARQTLFGLMHGFVSNLPRKTGVYSTLYIQLQTSIAVTVKLLDHCVYCCSPAGVSEILVYYTPVGCRHNVGTDAFLSFLPDVNITALTWLIDDALDKNVVECLCRPAEDCTFDIRVKSPNFQTTYLAGRRRIYVY